MNTLLLLAAACLQPLGPLVPFDYNKTGVAQGCAEMRRIRAETGFRRFLVTAPTFDGVMYGPTTLVAPLLGESGTRKVYLPEGIWTDTLTGARHEVGPEGGGSRICRGRIVDRSSAGTAARRTSTPSRRSAGSTTNT